MIDPTSFKPWQFIYWKIRRGRVRTKYIRLRDSIRYWRNKRRKRLKAKCGSYLRAGTVSVESVLPLVYIESSAKLCGETVKLTSKRYKCFKKKGIRCRCGLTGKFFAIEKHRSGNGPYHLNLYGFSKKGKERMMTVDHIWPKSKGGSNSVSNLQPMCYVCNRKKGNKLTKQDKVAGRRKRRKPEKVVDPIEILV